MKYAVIQVSNGANSVVAENINLSYGNTFNQANGISRQVH